MFVDIQGQPGRCPTSTPRPQSLPRTSETVRRIANLEAAAARTASNPSLASSTTWVTRRTWRLDVHRRRSGTTSSASRWTHTLEILFVVRTRHFGFGPAHSLLQLSTKAPLHRVSHPTVLPTISCTGRMPRTIHCSCFTIWSGTLLMINAAQVRSAK